MKILFIPGIVEETIGGAELQASYIAEALEQEGHQIFGIHIHPKSFATPRYPGFMLPRSRLAQRLGANSIYMKRIYDSIKKIKPDVIYSRAYIPYSLAPAVYYSQKNHCKSIWHIARDDLVKKYQFNSWKHLPFQVIDKLSFEYSIRFVTYIFSQTKHQSQLLQKNYKQHVSKVIPNCHPTPRRKTQKSQTVQVVWVANFKKLKQPEKFIRLANKLQGCTNARFIMIGRSAKNPWMDSIKQMINNAPNLIYMGSRSVDEVNKTLAQSHIFVNTSLYEGFPNTFIQAWMRKVPVVSMHADIDGILEQEKFGFLCHNFKNLLHRTKLLVDNESLRYEMSEASQTYAFKNFSIEANLPEILSAFTE
ncbi:MAG: glycosyltransferase family 4 protein [Desulfobacteraceae bacterium]|nr:glycosyltransferase family 4 protein [Desulfobacteraceae bacterium]